ncbi:branched-chain amino acid ABC transporter permease [Blastococcus saxobsidens]|uniref:ABC-type branched-chain amino acid transport system, permease component n=1 Tax=Blastococcus saxobsidens (strain DD2) TaxID=1146883 RepID=H6RX48_BLASD|nr:branched-chain amino acid ABC transporter permease [Blastococcus saxobsidens]CCG03456.1 ABC-type branched-chain amino acid transport system, permease component [Blastococcus saxobsidens DD2]
MDKLLASRSRAVAGLVVLAIVLVMAPLVSSPYINYQLSTIAVFAVAILGLNIVMGYTGQVSLGQSAFLGLGAYIAAYGVLNDWPVALSLLLCAIIPAAVGMLVALAAARLRGLALAMITLALPIIGVPLARRFSDFTGGSQGQTVRWLEAPGWSGLANDQWRYYVVVVIAVVAFALARNLVRGRVGRSFAIVKENEAVALSMGVSPYRTKVLAFTIASLLGGVSGFMYLGVVQYTSPETLSFFTSINLVAAMVIGGSASIVGTALGSLYYVLVPLLAGQVNSSRTALISGVILLAVLFLLPAGLVSLPRRLARLASSARRRGHPTTDPPAPEIATPPASAPSDAPAKQSPTVR